MAGPQYPSVIIKGLPNSKLPGMDGITAEVVKLGRGALRNAVLPLYRAILRGGRTPDKRNVAGLHLTWK